MVKPSTLRELVDEHTGLGPADIDHLQRLAGDWQLISDLSFADLLLWVPAGWRPEERPTDPDASALSRQQRGEATRPSSSAGWRPEERPTDPDASALSRQQRGEATPPRIRAGGAYVCVAQVRPTTAPTAYQDDQVGKIAHGAEVAHLEVARTQGRIWREGDPVWYGDTPARHEAVPVRRRGADGEAGDVIAVVGRDTNLSTARTPSQLELNYLTTADDLAQMIADGTFPPPRHAGETTSAPRVGDGLVRLDATGKVTYASPNAQSAIRRLGFSASLVGEDLAALFNRLSDDPLEGSEAAARILAALRGDAPPRKEVEARTATVLTRALPLMPAGVPIGALVLARDITEVKRRDRALITKDATIREIHHRVKNNLQTVAALLRLQARRVAAPEARAALEESVRRVASIALVHETLSMSVDEMVEFDGIVDRVATAAAEVAAPEFPLVTRREGSFGILPAEVATPLVMVLNELLLNAVEHGFETDDTSAEVVVGVRRNKKDLHVIVTDNGRGLPEDFNPMSSKRLGLQIIRTLTTGELRGTIELRNRAEGGAEAVLFVPLGKRER